MKETFIINSHIYKNATASMQPWRFRLSFERGGYMNCLLMLFTQGEKSKTLQVKTIHHAKTKSSIW